ncbi:MULTISPECIES: 2,5-didehydrogluconate reductase DkgB [Modicisalibacter]|uniref:2,5-didehydrogluconate reductase DkgB n=1 Tax=Modicisalibacter tunisiensis TaxID=390637 RepID=A0ABS7X275_9GAMM|nr:MULTISPECIES: 2,5-didehydrogluconate reductase DkgB [Modicisalibacter]MBZ9537581.1 2,5-didehydrogluconate reductase DkgB [Modicisalibacter tunisiensis]MBZ9568997.1 2,5-didehydrogluconate reductase DkgB [Modicisalibacter tunisiensis]
MASSIIPQPGIGTFRLKGQDAIDSVTSALAQGYRHVDTAQMYDNEEAVGEAIRRSEVPRDELFLTTKVWWDRLQHDALIASLEESVRKLGVDHVDLALIHWPSPGDEVAMSEYIGALAEARERGLTRHIGVSNFTIAHLNEALSVPGGEHIVTNQIEVHPFLANHKLARHCQDKGIQVTGYMPLAVGKVLHEPVLQQIAANHEATPAQVALAWVAARDIVVIPSSTRPEHQRANLAALDLTLSDDEMARIETLDIGERIANPDFAPSWDT